MMFRYLAILCLLVAFSAACSPTTEEVTESDSAGPGAEEIHEEHEGEHEEENEYDEDDEHDEHSEDDDEDSHREHGAHEHGAALLLIAWSGNELAIDLDTPAYNVLGFEYAPSSEAEQAHLEESLAILEEGALLELTAEAECSLQSGDVTTNLVEEEVEDEETHSDIEVAYQMECQHPEELETLDAGPLFAQFPNFESLRVQWVSDSGQSAKELTPDDAVLAFDNG
jgi:hypothetical protein